MSASEMFLGAVGGTVSALIVLVLLTLMLTMSLRLLQSRRKKAYFSLTVSLLFVASQYIVIVTLGGKPGPEDGGPWTVIVQALQALSLIFLNSGLYQLYNPSKRKTKFVVYTGAVLALAIAAGRQYAALEYFADTEQATTNAFLNVWLDLYIYAILFFCFRFIPPAVGQSWKYQWSLVVLFAAHSADMVNEYVQDGANVWLAAAGNWLPVVYFFIVFLFIFERVLELMQAVYQSSITDGLTGLYNRRFFMRRLRQWIEADIPLGIIFADIDNFKKLNDTKGHQEGDEALRRVARTALDIAEDTGMAGRFGGEEIVLLVEGNKNKVAQTAERLRERVEAEAGVTVSVGWAAHRKGVAADQLVKQADEAMYVSKRSGKNRVTAYKSGMAGERPNHKEFE